LAEFGSVWLILALGKPSLGAEIWLKFSSLKAKIEADTEEEVSAEIGGLPPVSQTLRWPPGSPRVDS
jgi:hypothetical protein